MVKEVNPRIHVNERDYPVEGHHCEDPEKAKLVKKLALMITDNIPRKLPGGMTSPAFTMCWVRARPVPCGIGILTMTLPTGRK